MDFLTATGNAGLITTINGIPVSDLVLGVSAFPTPNVAFPAVNADNFNLGSVASADGQPYFECTFAQPVTTVFLIENGGNDSGMVQGYDAAGNRMGTAVAFTTADYLRTEYRSGNNQVVAGLIVRLTAPVHAIRVLPPASGALGFDPLSISAVPAAAPPVASLQWQWNPVAGELGVGMGRGQLGAARYGRTRRGMVRCFADGHQPLRGDPGRAAAVLPAA